MDSPDRTGSALRHLASVGVDLFALGMLAKHLLPTELQYPSGLMWIPVLLISAVVVHATSYRLLGGR